MSGDFERERHAANRLDAFVDAAFAFAVTLLVIATAAPPATLDDLALALGRVPASACAFALIAVFWVGHKGFSRLTDRRDTLSNLLSLAIVFTVLVYVYPLRLLTESALFWMSGGRLPGLGIINSYDDLGSLYVLYGLGFAVLATLFALLFRNAVRRADALGVTREGRAAARDYAEIWLILALVGVLSVVLAVVAPLHRAPWLPGFSYALIPLLIGLRGAVRSRRGRPGKRLDEKNSETQS